MRGRWDGIGFVVLPKHDGTFGSPRGRFGTPSRASRAAVVAGAGKIAGEVYASASRDAHMTPERA